jgi:hypothetical protein
MVTAQTHQLSYGGGGLGEGEGARSGADAVERSEDEDGLRMKKRGIACGLEDAGGGA